MAVLFPEASCGPPAGLEPTPSRGTGGFGTCGAAEMAPLRAATNKLVQHVRSSLDGKGLASHTVRFFDTLTEQGD